MEKLHAEIGQLVVERASLEGLWPVSLKRRYRLAESGRPGLPVARLCELLLVSRFGCQNQPLSRRTCTLVALLCCATHCLSRGGTAVENLARNSSLAARRLTMPPHHGTDA